MHHDNRKIHNAQYKTTYDDLMTNNLCQSPYFNKSLIPLPCENLFNDAPIHVSKNMLSLLFD